MKDDDTILLTVGEVIMHLELEDPGQTLPITEATIKDFIVLGKLYDYDVKVGNIARRGTTH